MSGYIHSDRTRMAEKALEVSPGLKAILISGAPGTGKTSFARHFAEKKDAKVEYVLLDRWDSTETLFEGVDPGEVAAKVNGSDDAEAWRDGPVLRAIKSSQEGKVVLILDEIDKTTPGAESALLDFLQTGEFVDRNGEVHVANTDNLFVVATTNQYREPTEAFLRRFVRVEFDFLPFEEEVELIRKEADVWEGLASIVVKLMTTVRRKGETSPSLEEGIRLAKLATSCEGSEEANLAIQGCLVKNEADWKALEEAFQNPGASLWGAM